MTFNSVKAIHQQDLTKSQLKLRIFSVLNGDRDETEFLLHPCKYYIKTWSAR